MRTVLMALSTAAALILPASLAAQDGSQAPAMPPGMHSGMSSGDNAPATGSAPGMPMMGTMPMMCPMMGMMSGMRGMPAMDAGMPAGDDGPSSLAYQGANNKMHRNMAIAYSGDADIDFAKSMIPHHQGAIDTAKTVLAFGTDPEIRKLAEDIIKAQEGEIAFLQGWLKEKGQ